MEQHPNLVDQIVLFRSRHDPLFKGTLLDGTVTWQNEREVDVCYLLGLKSTNDTIPIEDVVAVVDQNEPWISPPELAPYNGRFRLLNLAPP